MPKVILTANTDWYLYNFRLSLARYLREHGLEVILVSPPGRFAEHLHASGFRWLPWSVGRQTLAPWTEAGAFLALERIRVLMLERKIEKLQLRLGGIRDMRRLPDMLVIGKTIGSGAEYTRVRKVVDRLLPPYIEPERVRVHLVDTTEWNAAAERLYLGLASDLKPDNIAVNCLSPSRVVLTEGWQAGGAGMQIPPEMVEPPEAMANAAVFLAQQDASGITGTIQRSEALTR